MKEKYEQVKTAEQNILNTIGDNMSVQLQDVYTLSQNTTLELLGEAFKYSEEHSHINPRNVLNEYINKVYEKKDDN